MCGCPEGNSTWAGCVPKHVQRLEAKLAEHLQRRILHSDAELLVLNKPAGLPVQGGDRIHVSVDSLLPHLRFGSAENPRCSAGSATHAFLAHAARYERSNAICIRGSSASPSPFGTASDRHNLCHTKA